MFEAGDVVDAPALRRWAELGLKAIEERRDEINVLNVFPVPDGDTGTNLLITVRSAVDWLHSSGTSQTAADVLDALARGAFTGARGNSGVILAQMLRGMADATATAEHLDAAGIAGALDRAAVEVMRALSTPADGTIVSVLRAAAAGASRLGVGATPADVALAAADAAAAALQHTVTQLDVLAEAGVVDAGGLGLMILLDVFVEVVTGERPDRRLTLTTRPVPPVRSAARPDASRHDDTPAHNDAAAHGGTVTHALQDYEVMYFVSGSDDKRMETLRTRLDTLGDSVAVVGDGAGTWSVHVHCCVPGAAVEAGLAAGSLHRIEITCFALDAVHRDNCDSELRQRPASAGRAVLAVVEGDGAAQLFEAEGAVVVRADRPMTIPGLLDAIRAVDAPEVLVLPNGSLSEQNLVAVGAAARDDHRAVMFLPSWSMVQGLASLAVHDAERESVDDAFTMTEAAATTRWGSLRIAQERALTWVGTCEPGNSLGLAGHDVVVIEHDLVAAGASLLDKILAAGGELVTMLVGSGAPDGLAEQLTAHLDAHHPEVEVVVYHGGQGSDLLQLGVE
ncbi:DAK2 domain-containing protein [Rhodococcus zopfii]|uniref:DAK2 domain-containing protein n=1 Tax=Rhodococcus zopfii TaxID=43772 RepID=UPI0011111E12|nr:DAK2 domain-containing protein [Rhodococcus zopfii]